MRNIILGAILIIFIILCGGIYAWNGREGVRTGYQGYVKIVPIATTTIVSNLEKNGCTLKGENCHYHYEKDSLYVNLYRYDIHPFGPGGSYQIKGNAIYSEFDLEGRRDSQKFETALRTLLQKSGYPVTPIDGTWTITGETDRTGVQY
jgi:hypothetical protein